MSPASTEKFLLEQYAGHPASQLQDLRKALYQSVFGCEHLITDTSAAAEGIRREAAEAGPCSREIEALDGPWSRVQLGVLADGLTPETLACIFARSAAMPHGDADALQEKLTVLRRLIHSGALPYSPAEADAELADWQKNGFPACRHSEEYRAAYRPAYRVLHRTYVRLLPLLAAHELSPQLLAYEPCLAGSLPEGSPRPGRPGRRARRRARKKGAELYEPSKNQQGE